MDDLFGSDEERVDQTLSDQINNHWEEALEDTLQTNESQTPFEPETDLSNGITIKTSLPSLNFPIQSDLFLAKLPSFLDIEPRPFDVSTYEPTDDANLIENTIRWRYNTDENGKPGKESNARFIRWSDGSLSLLLGKELFQVVVKNIEKDHEYIMALHPEEIYLETMAKVSNQMSFRPHSLNSTTHKKLTMVIANQNRKDTRTKTYLAGGDPEKEKLVAERIEAEKSRFKKKLEAKRRNATERYAFNETQLEAEDVEQDWEQDDFVVQDDDDEDRDEKINSSKNTAPITKKRNTKLSDTDDDDEGDTDQESESNEDVRIKSLNYKVQHASKRRALFDSTDEDDE